MSAGHGRAAPPSGIHLLFTVEHGGSRVPPEYRNRFRGRAEELASHRGWDPGTLALARTLAERFGAPMVSATVTRLLVDLNRSSHNPRVFSDVTRALPRTERLALLDRYHAPHWRAVRAAVADAVADRGRLLHVGVHSFAPVLGGRVRRPDLALLYDPARPGEVAVADAWLQALAESAPGRVLRRNDPYRGNADGLTTALRKEHSAERYVGIELEVNQKHVGADGRFPRWVVDAVAGSLAHVLAEAVTLL